MPISLSKFFLNRTLSSGFSCLALLVLLVLSAPSLLAQGYGSVSGTVTDPSGAAIPNATITATQVDTHHQTIVTATSSRSLCFHHAAARAVQLQGQCSGLRALSSDRSPAGQPGPDAHPRLAIGATTQTVEVSTAPPQIDTTTGTMSEVIDHTRVVDLPLNGRNASSLLTLVAGVSDATNEGNGVNQGNGKTFPAVVVATSNGTLPNQDNYLLDGGNNVDELTNVNAPFPMPDAVQEFSVQTSNYDAQFGQSAGAVVNIVTRAGANAFHGDLFEFLRNGYFNAATLLRHHSRTTCIAISSAAPSAVR